MTCPESWLIPSVLTAFGDDFVQAEFGWHRAKTGLDGYRDWMDEQGVDLDSMVLRSVLEILGRPGGSSDRVVVEKTPRNSLYASQLLATDRNVRAVVLVRNPIGVVQSAIESWRQNRWLLLNNRDFIVRCYMALAEAVRDFPDQVFLLRYEDLLTDPRNALVNLNRSVGLECDFERLPSEEGFAQGSGLYRPTRKSELLSVGQLAAPSIRSLIRRRSIASMLNDIGRENLENLGYGDRELSDSLTAAPVSVWQTLADIPFLAAEPLVRLVDPVGTSQRIARRRMMS